MKFSYKKNVQEIVNEIPTRITDLHPATLDNQIHSIIPVESFGQLDLYSSHS